MSIILSCRFAVLNKLYWRTVYTQNMMNILGMHTEFWFWQFFLSVVLTWQLATDDVCILKYEYIYVCKYVCAKANWLWGRVGWMLADHRDGLSSSSFLAWSSIAQSVCQQAFSLLVNRYLRPWVRILPSAEEDNLSPLDSNIACLCQSIEINNKHIYIYTCICSIFQHVIVGKSWQIYSRSVYYKL